MNKAERYDEILCELDSLFAELKQLGANKDTLDILNALCESVELDLREAASD